MANRWNDSCGAYASTADALTAGYTSGGNSGTYQTTGGRWGQGALRVANGANQDFIRSYTGLTAWAVGTVWRFISGPPNGAFFYMREGTTVHLDLRLDGSNRIILTRNGTLLGTGSTGFNTGTDYVIQVKFSIHDTTGSAEVWINDTKEIDVSGVDTRNGGTGVVDNFRWGVSGSAFTADISEIYVNDTTGSSPNNGIWGSYRIDPRRVSAAGNYSQWTPLSSTNASNVDDTQGNDGDTTYNSSSTAAQKDTYQMTAIPPTSGTIPAIMHRIVARKDDAGVRTIRPIQRQGGTDYNGTSQNITTAYAHYTEVKETNPATGVAYTVSEMRSTTPELGYELVA